MALYCILIVFFDICVWGVLDIEFDEKKKKPYQSFYFEALIWFLI